MSYRDDENDQLHITNPAKKSVSIVFMGHDGNSEDIFLQFFMEMLEPVYKALEASDMQLLFDTLKVKRYPITKKVKR